MHGLVNRSIENFIRHRHSAGLWHDICDGADFDTHTMEPMIVHSLKSTEDILSQATDLLDMSRDQILEDIGTFLVADPSNSTVRRLLRYGGETFRDFLFSLAELPERARLAIDDLDLPNLRIEPVGHSSFRVSISKSWSGFPALAVGALRAMADDYGALVFITRSDQSDQGDAALNVDLLDTSFAASKPFSLAMKVAVQ